MPHLIFLEQSLPAFPLGSLDRFSPVLHLLKLFIQKLIKIFQNYIKNTQKVHFHFATVLHSEFNLASHLHETRILCIVTKIMSHDTKLCRTTQNRKASISQNLSYSTKLVLHDTKFMFDVNFSNVIQLNQLPIEI
jgi:hypothetical protein